MIPTVQFDPGTLAIWITAGNLPEPDASLAAIVMRLTARGGDPADALTEIPEEDPLLRARLIWLSSAVWHEKRHYFDTCLTNYGARRFRDLWTLAANFDPVAAEATDRGEPLWLPVEIYGDPIQRAVMGIAEPPSNVIEIARRARKMKNMMTELDAPIRAGTDQIHLGGEAQMEGLAQVSQLHSIEHSFGIDGLVATSTKYVHRLPQHGPYRAIEAVAGALGCVRTTPKGIIAANTGLAAALFTTALCGQFYGHGPTPPADVVSPPRRLERMLEALGRGAGRFDMQDEESAEIVDKLARRLWGRTALEEIAVEIDAMEERVDLKTAPWLSDGGLYDVIVDFIALRRRLLQAARERGSASLLPRAFATEWRDRLRPWHVVAWPSGHPADEEGRMILGVKLQIDDERKHLFPETVGLAWLNTADPPGPFAPQNDPAWLQMLTRHGPRALLMLNGRQHRRMVPNELERAVEEIRINMEVRFHPRFEWPERRDQETCVNEAIALAEFSGRSSFTCDITGEEIRPIDAAVLTPWEFRHSGLKQRFQEAAAPIGEILLLFNWSDWVVRRDLLH